MCTHAYCMHCQSELPLNLGGVGTAGRQQGKSDGDMIRSSSTLIPYELYSLPGSTKGSTESRTRVGGVRIHSANHYTIPPAVRIPHQRSCSATARS